MKNHIIVKLIDKAECAADWLCDSHPGSDPWERGNELRKAVAAAKRQLSKADKTEADRNNALITHLHAT